MSNTQQQHPSEPCRRCGCNVVEGRCEDITCPYSDRDQGDPAGMIGVGMDDVPNGGSTSKHTPGRWRAITSTDACFHRGNRVSIVSTIDEFDQTVAEVWPTDGDSDIADGRLIAAAPETKRQRDELLAALEGIFHHAYDDDTPVEDIRADFDRMRQIAATAISNATKEEA